MIVLEVSTSMIMAEKKHRNIIMLVSTVNDTLRSAESSSKSMFNEVCTQTGRASLL